MKIKLLCLIFTLSIAAIKPQNNTPIFVTSIPKSGTHLLTKCISLLTQKKPIYLGPKYKKNFNIDPKVIENEANKLETKYFLCKHIFYSNTINDFFIKNNYKVLFIYRDPRAQITSVYTKPDKKNGSTLQARLLHAIKNGALELYFNAYFSWAQQKNVLAIRFEDLVGPMGGGTSEAQFDTVKKIALYLNLNCKNSDITLVCSNLFGGTSTFVKGQIDRWKKEFNQEIKREFKKHGSDILVSMQYEKDNNW